MVALVLLVVSIGLADSVNPSTIAPALYLAAGEGAVRRVVSFGAGVFVVYLVGGLVVTIGPGRLLVDALPTPDAHVRHLLELALGAAALAVAVVLWFERERVARRFARPPSRPRGAAFALGATIMAVELPTAFPYFAVIAAVAASRRSLVVQAALIVLFNAVFVLPLCAIAVARSLLGDGGEAALVRLHTRMRAHAAPAITAVVLLVAAVLLCTGAVGLARE